MEGPDRPSGAEAGSVANEPVNGSALEVFGWLRAYGTRRLRGELGDVTQHPVKLGPRRNPDRRRLAPL